jgi:uncharacterized phage protein gp47/JayE
MVSGGISETSSIGITRVSDLDLGIVYAPPTGVNLARKANGVEIQWSNETSKSAAGYNIYASTQPGGGQTGYLRLNATMVPSDSPTTTDITLLDSQEVVYDFTETSIADKDLSVTLSTINNGTGQLIEQKVKNVFPLISSPSYRLAMTFSRTDVTGRFSFVHDRNSGVDAGILNSDTWSLVPFIEPIYYVVTALYYDKTNNQLVESRYSLELAGNPLPLDTTLKGIRVRDSSMVAQNYIATLQGVAPELSLIPGSTIREVHVEPFSNEIQKAYFLMDFVHRAKSFPALLAIDDPNMTGNSIAVSNSQYKTNLKSAISASNDVAVQALIDSAFDSLAANFGYKRQARKAAQIEQVFYTTTRPTKDLYVVANARVSSSSDPNAPNFLSRGLYVIPVATADRYYNPSKKRYEVKVSMFAEIPGVEGNVAAGVLDTVVNGANGLSTINEQSGYGGQESQSNLSLTETCMRALVSLDTGTYSGYEKLAYNIPGVEKVFISRSGDSYMMRDWDPVRQKHVGGKVDVYIKGTIERTVQETFAFSFEVAKNVRFRVIDPVNLIFRADDSRLNVDNPIQEMLFNVTEDLGLYNYSNTPIGYYDLTGVEYVDYRTIKLSTLLPQPSTHFDDFIEGDYRFLSNNRFTATLQPVRSVGSVVGQASGVLDPAEGYTLYKTQDPLLEGESTIASDYIEIHQIGGIPTGTPIAVNDESHVLIGSTPELLNSVGVNEFTLNVYSEDRLTQYNGPDAESPDYLVIPGTQTSPLSIVRTRYSNIPNGATVSVDYEHDENFAVTYTVNDVLQRVQKEIDVMKHITADVLVKQATENALVINTTVQLKPNQSRSYVDNQIRTSYSNMILNKNVGDPIHVSDVIAAIDNVNGVDFVVQPFSRMTLGDGALRIRDEVLSDYDFLPSISSGNNAVYILTQPLLYSTMNGGGPDNIHHGVYMDNLIMEKAKSLEDVQRQTYLSWIIGREGAVIPGYSDDATLYPKYVTASEVTAARLRLTANKIVVSLNYGLTPAEVPTDHMFSATYVVEGDTQTIDVDVSQVEYLTPGDLTMTFRSA